MTHVTRQTLAKFIVMYTCASILGRGLLDLGPGTAAPLAPPPPGPALRGGRGCPILAMKTYGSYTKPILRMIQIQIVFLSPTELSDFNTNNR
jgi:hypothetical protein